MKNHLFQSIATAFPSAYRFFSVYLVTLLASTEVANLFSQSFFIVSLIATFSGVAVSTQSYVKEGTVSVGLRVLTMLALTLIVSVPTYFLWSYGLESYFYVIGASLFFSLFMIAREDSIALNRMNVLAIRSALSTLLFVVFFFVLEPSGEVLVLGTFLFLFVTVFDLFDKNESSLTTKKTFFQNVFSYSLSGGLSTGISFLLPLIVIDEFGEQSSSSIAQIFTLAMMFQFVPRFLSTRFLSSVKSSSGNTSIASFERLVFAYVIAIVILFVLVTSFLFESYNVLIGLFCGLLSSQLSLPYSNVFMTLGKGSLMLRINLASFVLLLTSACAIFLFFDKGEERGEILCWLYFSYQIMRAIYMKFRCHSIYGS